MFILNLLSSGCVTCLLCVSIGNAYDEDPLVWGNYLGPLVRIELTTSTLQE